MKRFSLLSGGGILVLCSMLYAAVPQLINFQGILRDESGNPVANGSYSVTFSIYDAPSVGNVLWAETTSVSTNSGLFTTLLGADNPLPDSVFYDSSRYLGIKVGADPEMTPRQKLSSVGYSYVSSQWTSGTGPPFLLKGNTGVSTYEILYRLNGNVGIGTSNPLAKLDVLNTGSDAFDIKGIQSQVENASSGNAIGGYFATSTAGTGLHYGVYAQGNGSSSYGVYGSGGYGGEFSGTSYGVKASGFSKGGQFVGTGAGSSGLYAEGLSYGGEFKGTAGVYGEGGSYGVYGYSVAGTGVYGLSTGTAAVYGNIGGNFGTYGGYFQGDVKVERNLIVDGFIFKNGGGFKIDHPTDPASKYLYHSFVESPDMKNIYDGVVILDLKGEAIVGLPDWFGAVNKDFRYQLTAIGAPGPNLYIAEEISKNQFRIAGGIAGMKVSWQVTGICKDAYAEAHRIPVEEAKSGKELGKYLHPEEYGVSKTLGLHYEQEQKMAAEQKQMEERQAKMEAERLLREQKLKENK